MTQKKIHLMGIGGAGMSALATYLLEQGIAVSGCDVAVSCVTDRLQQSGAQINFEHHADHIQSIDWLVYSGAIKCTHPELEQAKKENKKIFSRSAFLAECVKPYKGISVAGSHGKSTTSAMLAWLLKDGGLDPSIAIGAEMVDLGCNAAFGKGEYFVYEADESDGSFKTFSPAYFVLNNLDDDHIDFYQTFEELKLFFQGYLKENLNKQIVVYGKDDSVLTEWEYFFNLETAISFGLTDGADVQAIDLNFLPDKTQFMLVQKGKQLGIMQLALPGKHNVLNALSALAVALSVGISFESCQKSLALFKGIHRRFQYKGKENQITVIDDYAHHPTEIAATIEAAQHLTQGRIFCVFQPHRYTRTRDLSAAFPAALSLADEIVLTDIYPASEIPIKGVNGELVYKESLKAGYKHFSYESDLNKIPDLLMARAKQGDLILTVGAGNVNEVGERLMEKLKSSECHV